MLLHIILMFVIVGVLMYLINQYVPMKAEIKNLMNITVIIILVVWVMQSLGLLTAIGSIGIKTVAYLM